MVSREITVKILKLGESGTVMRIAFLLEDENEIINL